MKKSIEETIPKYTVEIRIISDVHIIYGKDSHITKTLALSPAGWSSELCKRPGGDNVWAYNSHLENGFKNEWMAIEDGFYFILDKIKKSKNEIISLSDCNKIFWWCGCFYPSSNGVICFPSKLIIELAEYNFPIFFDNYFNSLKE